MEKVIVVGAAGVLGKLICTELLRIFNNSIKLVVTDYKIKRGENLANSLNSGAEFQYLDVDNEENIKKVIRNVDIVIVGLKQKTPSIQKTCIENKILCIDVTPFYDFVETVQELNQRAEKNNTASVVMSGFFPGLSGLITQKAIAEFQEITEINVALLQNANAQAGVTGIFDMLSIIAQPVKFQNNVLSGFTKKRKMHFQNHAKEKVVRLIEHSEKKIIKEKLTVAPIYYWTSWNVIPFNKLVSLLRKIGLLNILQNLNKKLVSKVVKHKPNKNENAFLTVEVKGNIDNKKMIRTISLSTFSDYHTTAIVTASLAKIALKTDIKGVVYPFEITNLDELLSMANCSSIIVEDVKKQQ
ncbi:saccharopine dehydrogenase [Niallia circulans]|uniref:saccharopine dehydrogenase NADP-binding domain-containing protein n=1 Tax=Niallia circulans TaxID=1397 RepID=UPI00077C33C3|nr:saccharopine dehydrogenase NADP-binding domain-containing protein [Niallia circulans]MDR4316254.1 hypothetical protein [Niallia circulans]MED3839130.1 saccharopine dehydrogenase NADP-binding domain-containing protein [Niallia circulans]MED4245512.1 saccharopine dehydrogenase NADP-binding domain-containing protein [Niallia circulans]MED4250647.1 saccharopine dehydrogenase NADP-binding domain-containing protein [Niallia circulans]QKH60689.1 saccharopine dehydrogenase NADP-binding domain-conta